MMHIDDMSGGWFIGDFSPSAFRTQQFEIAIKKYKVGFRDVAHVHRVATEITIIISGRALMCDREVGEGDIIVIRPGESNAFVALSDVVLAVAKTPSVIGDKFDLEKGL